jgi:hypothetical protein
MKLSLHILLSLFLANLVFSQSSETDSISKSKISDLQFMVGKWKGSGWMMGRGGKSDFNQTENIAFKLDSTAILIEGKGTANGKTIHDALAILTYNKNDGHYLLRSYLPSGQNAEFKAELIDDKLYWYPNENVRYIIWLKENGQWYEKGEYNREDNWNQFFEMTLYKNE